MNPWLAKAVILIATVAMMAIRAPLYLSSLLAGGSLLMFGLWLFYRSHADLGANWSVTLEVREQHRLVTEGIYRHIRHPMYLAFLLYGLGQAIVIPNWVAGPSYIVAMVLLVPFRLGPEEALMREHFKSEYEAYESRTKRLVPGIW
jgi:protein-S-isoprenylcysteine O-methyltransferase Ste14